VDAFTGIGGACIRMACGSSNTKKIIANDWNSKRLQCALNNAKVY
jgi:tRNA G26 N,N-dimethylase Trm1